jgi:O-antigen/teichoic acid export membrane protein
MVLTAGLARVRYTHAFGRIVRSALSVLVLIAIAYGLMLGWVGPRLMHWLYSGRYDHLAGLLALVGWLPLLGVGATVLAPALRALERPDQVFVAYAASTAVSLSAGLYLTVEYGVTGAAIGLLLTTAVTTSVLGWKLITSLRRGPELQGEGGRPGAAPPGSSATTARSPSENTT